MHIQMPVKMVEKPWGRAVLPDVFEQNESHALQKIGEVWFEPSEDLSELLVKYIFTSEKLSVQVHPSDAQTMAQGIGRQGKEECWLVLDAEPDARLGIGFSSPVDATTLEHAARNGSIETMLTWHRVVPGDFFYIPANTVHAIGAGISLIEIQQNSDITYRLYDYGRPRALHLAEGLAVAHGSRYNLEKYYRRIEQNSQILVDGPIFRLDQIRGKPDAETCARYTNACLIIPREGIVMISGQPLLPGQCAQVRGLDGIEWSEQALCLVAAFGSS